MDYFNIVFKPWDSALRQEALATLVPVSTNYEAKDAWERAQQTRDAYQGCVKLLELLKAHHPERT